MKQYKYFNNCKSINDIKETYKKLVKQFHPDLNQNSDTTQIMQEVNNEYDSILSDKNFINNLNTENKKEYTQTDFTAYKDIINKLIKLQGITIELVGSWIWIFGNSYPHREVISSLKFRYSGSRKGWYYFENIENTKKTKPKSKSMEENRERHGSVIIKSDTIYSLNNPTK